ncbi:MAG: hypothetical protein JW910_10835 [Anaerolineae bacterium]|nr:hypothetical protein [Anaerolineae bacterium]
MRRTLFLLLLLVLALSLTACLGSREPAITDRDIVAGTLTAAVELGGTVTPYPTSPPTPRSLPNSDDPLTIVLGGLFGNGGYWTWTDIDNLLGTYATFGEYTTITVGDVSYTGVPITHLFSYARLSENALNLTIFTRDGIRVTLASSQLRTCQQCLLVRVAEGSITLAAPGTDAGILNRLVRIEAR